MCLERDNKPLQKATEDIECFKCVTVAWKNRHKFKTRFLRKLGLLKQYETCFKNCPVTIGKIVTAKPRYTVKQLEYMENSIRELRDGFIHSYRNFEDAREYKSGYYLQKYTVIIKCIIPKGTYYFTGLNNGESEGYASCSIKYVKVVG